VKRLGIISPNFNNQIRRITMTTEIIESNDIIFEADVI